MKNNFLSLIIVILLLAVTTSCSGFLSDNLDLYYNQQQNGGNKPPVPPTEPDIEEEELPENVRKVTVFEVLGPDGSIDTEVLSLFSDDNQVKILETLPIKQEVISSVTTDSFMDRVMNISIVDNYAPNMNYIEGTWSELERNGRTAYQTSGAGYPINAPLEVTSDNITFYMYKGSNPEYEATDIANTISYGDGSESRVNRFMFYEVTGKAVIADLWNMLVCVDTYTNLIFAFAYPSSMDAVGNPNDWAGLSKTFYTYDPIGYIDDDGTFVIHDWYTKQLNKKEFAYTQKTGLSPYYDEYQAIIEVPMDEAFLSGVSSTEYLYYNLDGTLTNEKITFSADGKTISLFDENDAVLTYTFKSATDTKNAVYLDSANEEKAVILSEDKIILNFNDKEYVIPMNMTVTAKSIKNLGMRSLKKIGTFGDWNEVDEAYITYAIRSSIYENISEKVFDTIAHKNNGDVKPSGKLLLSTNTVTIPVANNNNISGVFSIDEKKEYNLNPTRLEKMSIALDAIITTQGCTTVLGVDFIETATNNGRKIYNNFNTPNVVLSYDAEKKGYVLDLENSELTNTIVTDSEGNDFIIKLGEEKDIVINFNNQSEITYTISLK